MIFSLELDWERAGLPSSPLPQPPQGQRDTGREYNGKGLWLCARCSVIIKLWETEEVAFPQFGHHLILFIQ